jgi:hypothetical protein
MLTMLTAPAMTLLLLGVIFSLGAAFMWMFWEIEQMKQRRNGGRFRQAARRPPQNGPL